MIKSDKKNHKIYITHYNVLITDKIYYSSFTIYSYIL